MDKLSYRFENNRFMIDAYDRQKTFASFLPGLAGKRGIPLWAFYVNRGQGICSFGLRDKNGQILEFHPGNLAYLYTSKIGFRTFVKHGETVHEIFKPEDEKPKRRMEIGQTAFSIVEDNRRLGLRVRVTYFGLPGDSVAALVRSVEFTNTGSSTLDVEVLDGLSQILPAGIDHGGYKAMSNLLRSWMDVERLDEGFAFYKLRSATGDTSETAEVKDGNFYLSFIDGDPVTPIADMDLVYGYDTAMNHPAHFAGHSLLEIKNSFQATANKVPCGFTGFAKAIQTGETVRIDTLIGYTHDVAAIADKRIELAKAGHAWFEAKREEAERVVGALLDDVKTKTAYPVFDEMIRQNYLDNLLRGGYPMTIKAGNRQFVYYLYSRKHGDLERDYNFFSIAPEFYSQGNGNFRDVCQNRRSDVFFHPETGDYSIKVFASLIQADGYNPLGINGSTFTIPDKTKIAPIAARCFGDDAAKMVALLSGKFTPGSIVNAMEQKKIHSPHSDDELFGIVFADATQNIEAAWNEGYWTDHWTYILDLVERYLEMFPDRRDGLLYKDRSYRTFESPVSVRPRREKHVIDKSGAIRQYGALRHPDKEKIARLGLNEHGTNWFSVAGVPFETNLYAKLLILAANKFATLDPEGLGVEMEANRPGWNDAMNGLPGIFGSGMSETVELGRLARFLKSAEGGTIPLPVEFVTFAKRLEAVKLAPGFARWDAVATIREEYRESVRFGSAQTIAVESAAFRPLVDMILAATEDAVKRAINIGGGIIPTYFYYEATAFEPLKNADGTPDVGSYGLPLVNVTAFQRQRLPDFLEAPARWMKTAKDKAEALAMADAIKASGLYDAPLGTYKTSADLDACGHEIGRIRAFTKGWLERESNFLHMTYKYLLGLLKAGLYGRFFEEARTNLVCFMDPATYGRPTIENSSFIATSNNPNPAVRGQGFVSRLSGSTAEMLSIWTIALFGKELFRYEAGKLTLALKPLLPADFFSEGRLEATFIGQKVVYLNASDKDGWNLEPMRYELRKNGMAVKTIVGRRLEGVDAAAVREGAYDEIVVILS